MYLHRHAHTCTNRYTNTNMQTYIYTDMDTLTKIQIYTDMCTH